MSRRRGQAGIIIKVLPAIVLLLIVMGIILYFFGPLILDWLSGLVPGEGFLAAMGKIPWLNIDNPFGGDKSKANAGDDVTEEFERFIADVNDACSSHDSETDAFEQLGEEYDFAEINTISISKGSLPGDWYTNQFTAKGDDFEVQREAEECSKSRLCRTEACVAWYIENFDESTKISYAIGDGGDGVILTKGDGVPGFFESVTNAVNDMLGLGKIDDSWFDCDGECGDEARITRVCNEAIGSSFIPLDSDEIEVTVEMENTGDEEGDFNIRIRPPSGQSHVLLPCGLSNLGCSGLNWETVGAGGTWEASWGSSGSTASLGQFNDGYVIQLRKQNPNDQTTAGTLDENKNLVDAVAITADQVPSPGNEQCISDDDVDWRQ